MKTYLYIVLMLFALGPKVLNAKVLTYCSEGDPGTMSPVLGFSSASYDATSRQMYNRLVDILPETAKPAPSLAYSWTSIRNMEYLFNLRRGVKFHTTEYFKPSRHFNADDVVFTFERLLNKNHPYHNVGGGEYRYFYSMGLHELIKRVEKIDNYKVLVKLKKPDASIISTLAMDFASIYSKEYADKRLKSNQTDLFDSLPVGTGPFVYDQYIKDKKIVYRSNRHYWQKPPIIEKLIFEITANGNDRYNKLISGECDMLAYPLAEDIPKLKKNKNITMYRKSGLNVAYLAYNTTEEPFNDVEVRRALNMAVDRKRIIKEVYKNRAKIAYTPVPPNNWSHNKGVKKDVYDPILSKSILKRMGIVDLKTNIWIVPLQMQTNPNTVLTAQIIKENWEKVGVKLNIIKYPWKEFFKHITKIDRAGVVLMGYISDNGDPDNFLYTLLGCDGIPKANFAMWCYKPYDSLVRKAKISNNMFERTNLYIQAQRIFKEQAPWATIAYNDIIQPVRTYVKKYQIDVFGRHMFERLDIRKE